MHLLGLQITCIILIIFMPQRFRLFLLQSVREMVQQCLLLALKSATP